jgi:hypothetical protein
MTRPATAWRDKPAAAIQWATDHFRILSLTLAILFAEVGGNRAVQHQHHDHQE